MVGGYIGAGRTVTRGATSRSGRLFGKQTQTCAPFAGATALAPKTHQESLAYAKNPLLWSQIPKKVTPCFYSGEEQKCHEPSSAPPELCPFNEVNLLREALRFLSLSHLHDHPVLKEIRDVVADLNISKTQDRVVVKNSMPVPEQRSGLKVTR